MSLFRRKPKPGSTDILNLAIAGAQRSGTTSLKYYLKEHPEIGFIDDPQIKISGTRMGFPFASPILAHSAKGEDTDVYRRICRKYAGKKTWIGTKQPYFMVFPHVPFNLREHLPEVRLIFILRNPVEAAYSAYWNGKNKGRREGSFEDCLRLAEEEGGELADPQNRGRWVKFFRDPDRIPLLVDRGFYYQQLMRFYRLFPREQILVLRFDRFVRQTAETMREVLTFLDLDPDFEFTRLREVKNPAERKAPMGSRTRERLQAIYAESNRRLLEFLGWPVDLWD